MHTSPTIEVCLFFFFLSFLHLILLQVHTFTKRKCLTMQTTKVDSIVFGNPQGHEQGRVYDWSVNNQITIFKILLIPPKTFPGFLFKLQHVVDVVGSRKCEHELILFECKINYAKTFELIFIAIHLHYELLYFL